MFTCIRKAMLLPGLVSWLIAPRSQGAAQEGASTFPAITRKRLIGIVLVLGALLAAGTVLYALGAHTVRSETADLEQHGRNRLEVYAAGLRNAIVRYDALPMVLADHPYILTLLRDPQSAEMRDVVSRYLARCIRESPDDLLFLLDVNGKVLAASNWNTPKSLIGKDYGYRPYFLQAKEGHQGRFYGIGLMTRQSGYFLSYPVRNEKGIVIGVVAIRINLDTLERQWPTSGDIVTVVDGNGIVILSTDQHYKWHVVAPLSSEVRHYLEESRQYEGRSDFPLLPLSERARIGDGAERAMLTQDGKSTPMLIQQQALEGLNWKMQTYNDLSKVRTEAEHEVFRAAMMLFGPLLLLLCWWQYQRRRKEQRQADNALEQVRDGFRNEIELRVGELADIQSRLRDEVVERQRLEGRMRVAQDKLLNAGRFSVLGQITSSVMRELGRPIAALRGLIGKLDENGGEVKRQIDGVVAQTERLAAFTIKLGEPAGRTDDQLEAVTLMQPIANTIALFDSQLRHQHVRLEIEEPEVPIYVTGNLVWLEQLFAVLIQHALDAVRTSPMPEIRIVVRCDGGRAQVNITDNGPGISDASSSSLFDPLALPRGERDRSGLALMTAQAIANDCGGHITVSNRDEGGAEFMLELSVVEAAG
ncbi:cache domain-containing protein [Jeongeupia wiesaeckerbachi]|uniref:sensor histidine kinase n=1 Tax=Jeongeupia wiesaeckerbachi TaxID=3051218 RepID=UPI003D809417